MQSPLPTNEAIRLEDLCRRMEQFTCRLAHDLLGSLQVITGYADLLADGTKGPLARDQLEYLNFILVGAESVRDTIERGQARLHEIIQAESKLK
jgi:signal transduction histidine kinase